ncbi:hypothetical protein CRM22_010780 [Opisthorchis felineus]|uniref:CFA20 domain-containing protein n=1 Tax=Opisthorchis felineus TaxID=147828 RepID=A0A4S2KLQ5_OPIFE|nr:hypothetical protein CRM22_010780 [Opisthorchis felineus]
MQEQTIFDATRPNPFLKCHLVGASNIFLVNSKPLRHKVLSLNSGQYESKLELPLKYVFARRPVCFVMLQLSVMKDAHFKFELKLLTYQKKLHFLTFSTECEQIKETVQVTWIPLSLLIRSRWVNLSINLQMMLNELRSTGAAYSLESIAVYASCQLSRIAICRNQYQDTSHLLSGNNDDILIVTQVLDLAKIRISQWKHCTSSNTEELHNLVAGKENEGDQVRSTFSLLLSCKRLEAASMKSQLTFDILFHYLLRGTHETPTQTNSEYFFLFPSSMKPGSHLLFSNRCSLNLRRIVRNDHL